MDQHFGANLKKQLFAKFCCKFLFFSFFCFLSLKTFKIKISTSDWGAQDPNAGKKYTTLENLGFCITN